MKNFLRVVITLLLFAELSPSYAQYPACPQVVTNANSIIPCGQTCTNLTASALGGFATTTYTYAAIPYAPPVAPGTGTALALTSDDEWSRVITLPFTFCYFGQPYTKAIFNTNGCISFNRGNARAGASYIIDGPAPLAQYGDNPDLNNSILGPFQDLDNSKQGTIAYYLGGTAPCQFFAVSWSNCAMYGDAESVSTAYCTLDDHQTQQIVIYQTSNVIDINIAEKDPPCDNKIAGTYWNGGFAIEGIQNGNGTVFIGPANRNATQWSATNDGLRFTPAGAATYTITWFQGTTQIGTGSPFQVCPTGLTNYTVKAVYDNCSSILDTVSATVSVDIDRLTLTDSFHQPSCGINNGSVFAKYTDNSLVTSFGWSPGGAGQTSLTGLGPGTYIFTVHDSSGCSKSDTVVLAATGGFTVTVPNDTVSSCGTVSGTLHAVVSGVTGPFTYLWNNTAASTTDTVTGLAAGTYTVTVTAPGGCSATASGTVVGTPGTPVIINTVKLVNVNCSGDSSGEIVVLGSNGPPPYSYAWSNSTTTADSITGLKAGSYTVTVTDRFGCSADSTYQITQGTPITFNTPVTTNVSCNGGSNGTITASATGGTAPYTYAWSNNGITGATDSNLTANVLYTVTATDSNGCTASALYSVGQPNPLVIASTVIDSATCSSGGALIVTAGGGTGPYTYAWSNSGAGDSIGGLASGSYKVTITDHNGCTITDSLFVPSAANVIAFGPPILVQPTCNGGNDGSITATVTGATSTVFYSWSNIDSVAKDSNLVSASYSVTISEASGCSASATYFLGQPAALTLNAIIDSATCFGTPNGNIFVTATGGTGSLNYVWSPAVSTTDSAVNLAAGPYTVTVTDSVGCSVTASYKVGQPLPLNVDSSKVTAAGCVVGGTITLYVSGGTPTYTYSWTGTSQTGNPVDSLSTGNYSVTISDANGCSTSASFSVGSAAATGVTIDSAHVINETCSGDSSGSIVVFASDSSIGGPITYAWSNSITGNTITGLKAPNSYCVTATDTAGCSASMCYNISQPAGITFGTPVLTPPTCSGNANGCITASATGGTGTITYAWSNFTTGASDCGLVAGGYSVTATDSVGCSASAQYLLLQPQPDTVTGVVTNITCNGLSNGSITATGSGGTGSFTYSWGGGVTGATISNLGVGNYCVVATDSNSCTASACFNVQQPAAIVINALVATPVTCTAQGTDSVSASGGTGTLTYSWSNTTQTTAVITGLAANTYCVTITDSLSCTAGACDTVHSTAGTVTIDSSHVKNVTCLANGSIVVYASGGSSNLTYTWTGTTQTGDSVGNLTSGNYSVTVSDLSGCSASASFTINPATPVIITNAVVDSLTCNGSANGNITLTATGTGTLNYVWSPNVSTTNTATGLSAGQYCVTITDSLGCSATACYNVGQPVILGVTGTSTNITCGVYGTISLTVTGGTQAYSYTWTPNTASGANPTGLNAGKYVVTVTDHNSCTATDSFNITGATGPPLVITNVVIDSVSCNGGNNGSITVTVTGGLGHLTYSWTNSETSASDTLLTAGTAYGVTVTDSVGCTVSGGPYSVGQPNAVTVNGTSTNISCNTLGSISVTASGGTGALSYAWTPNTVSGANPTNLQAGTYVVTVTDQHGCSASKSFNITGTSGPVTLTDSLTNVSCNGANNGSIVVTPSGGATPYTYAWNPSTVGTTGTITNLGPGTYDVTVTSAGGGCSVSATYQITQPAAISANITASPILCFSIDTGVASVTSNGVTPLSYHWSTGSTASTVDSLGQGRVSVTVTDGNGCTVSASDSIGNDYFDLSTNPTQVTCATPVRNVVVNAILGGMAPFTFTFGSATQTTNDTFAIFDSIASGAYLVTLKDGAGCMLSKGDTINNPILTDQVSDTSTPASCTSATNGQIVVEVAPADSAHKPFTYSLNGGAFQSDSLFTGLAPGTYSVVVHNNQGCNDTINAIAVTSDSALSVTFPYDTLGQGPPSAINSDTITLQPTVSGFTNPVYSWTPTTGLTCPTCANPGYSPEPGAIVNGPTIYYVRVSDSLNPQCTAYDSVIIEPKGQFAMPDAFTPNGDGKNDYFGPVSVSYVTITTFHIYNRWGQIVHNGNTPWDGKFDGKEQPGGTYVYYIEVQHPDGYNYGNTVTEKKEGAVVLLR